MSVSTGKNIKINVSGTPIAFTTVEMDNVSGKTFEISDFAKRVWQSPERLPEWDDLDEGWEDYPYESWDAKFPYLKVFKDGTTAADRVDPANIVGIDYLTGRITFASSYDVVGATFYVSGFYVPMSIAGFARTADIEETVDLADITTLGTADTDTTAGVNVSRRKLAQLYDGSVSVSGFEAITEGIFSEGDNIYIEIFLDVVNHPNWRIVVKGKIGSKSISIDIENPIEFSAEIESNFDISEVME